MSTELLMFLAGAVFNLLVAVLITRFIYYPLTQTKSFVFTFIAFNTIVYFVLGLLTSTSLGVGVGFGLFAIFSVLRYRTDEMPIREMTYMFILVALPVLNSVLLTNEDYGRLLIANAFVIVLLFVLEREWGFHFEGNKHVTYDVIELITPDNREKLLADLRRRTGLWVKRVDIISIDFLRDIAELKIYYDDPRRKTRDVKLISGDEMPVGQMFPAPPFHSEAAASSFGLAGRNQHSASASD